MQKSTKRLKLITKTGGLSYLLSIVVFFTLGGIALIIWISLLQIQGIDQKTWALFCFGLISAGTIVSSSSVPRLRTLIHETKHIIPTLLTGGIIKDIKIGSGTGHVKYNIKKKDLKYVPLITLAPYFWPLFSLPVYIACTLLEQQYRFELTAILGAALAIDIVTGYQEIHPHQKDFKQVRGGFFTASLYIAGALFAWSNLCILWVTSGNNGLIYAGYITLNTIRHHTGI